MTRPGRLDAIVEADRTLDLLDIPKDQPVDVFAALSALGLEMAIVDLDGLLGVMLPHGRGGVLITSKRGSRVQRYTAAHEIGHWILHHPGPSVDGEAEILSTPSSERERQAQLFAAYFLMPPPLVDEAVARHGLRHGQVMPEQLYLVSRDMHVSYEAAAWRLVTHKVISSRELAILLNVNRLDAMKRAFQGRQPADGNGDLWLREYDSQHERIEVDEHDEVIVQLPENRSSGWQWLNATQLAERGQRTRRPRPYPPHSHTNAVTNIAPVPATPRKRQPADVRAALDLLAHIEPTSESVPDIDANVVTVVTDTFDPAGLPSVTRQLIQLRRQIASVAGSTESSDHGTEMPSPRIGGTGRRTMVLRCNHAGEETFQLEYTHAYDPNAPSVLNYILTLRVHPTPAAAYRFARAHTVDLNLRLDGDPDDNAVYSVVTT
ncbi:MAG: ImmA/IrrE family metallo-endopeptidase [Pseudonocardiaceae bacterium]